MKSFFSLEVDEEILSQLNIRNIYSFAVVKEILFFVSHILKFIYMNMNYPMYVIEVPYFCNLDIDIVVF